MNTAGKYPEMSNSDPLFEVAEYTQLMKNALTPFGTNPVFMNGWSNFNGGTGFNKILAKEIVGGVISLSGMVRGGTLTDGIEIATIAVGLRPNVSVYAGCLLRADTINRPGMISITSSGVIRVFGEMSGVSYVLLNTVYNLIT